MISQSALGRMSTKTNYCSRVHIVLHEKLIMKTINDKIFKSIICEKNTACQEKYYSLSTREILNVKFPHRYPTWSDIQNAAKKMLKRTL